MAINLDRLKKDLSHLILMGTRLEYDMIREIQGKAVFDKTIKDQLKEKADKFLENVPEFASTYEAWYSESLALLKQLLPDRVANFVSFYEKPKSRKDVDFSNYVIQDYLQGLRVTRGYQKDVVVDTSAAFRNIDNSLLF